MGDTFFRQGEKYQIYILSIVCSYSTQDYMWWFYNGSTGLCMPSSLLCCPQRLLSDVPIREPACLVFSEPVMGMGRRPQMLKSSKWCY